MKEKENEKEKLNLQEKEKVELGSAEPLFLFIKLIIYFKYFLIIFKSFNYLIY